MVHETKFLVPIETAPAILAWVRAHLEPDAHGRGAHSDEYFVQSIYFDTPQWHAFRKAGSFGRAKFRARRYGDADWLFLERKLKNEGLVRKRRSAIALDDLPRIENLPSAQWYHQRLALRGLVPVCYIQYERVARQTMTSDGALRLTVDRHFRFDTDVTLAWKNFDGGAAFLADTAIVELKYLRLPSLAKRLIEEFNLTPASASKFRIALRASRHASQIQQFGLPDSSQPSETLQCA